MDFSAQIDRIAEACYQQRDNEACSYIEQFLPELMGYIQKCQSNGEAEKAGQIVNVLKYVMSAMEAKDYVLVADYLKFELEPVV